MNLQIISTVLCSVIISGTVFAQESKDKQPPKPSGPPSVGVLRPKDPTGETLPLKLSAEEIESVKKQLFQIYQACFAYAQTNDQVFPDGESANEAFRELFIKGLIDDEKLFFIRKNGIDRKGKPDGDIGTARNQYEKALEAGECDFYYVRGQTADRDESTVFSFVKTTADDGRVHLIAAKTHGEIVDCVTKDGVSQEMKDGKLVEVSLEGFVAPLELEKKN